MIKLPIDTNWGMLSKIRGKMYDVCPKCVAWNTTPVKSGFWAFPESTESKSFADTFPPVTSFLYDQFGLSCGRIEVLFTKGYEPCDDFAFEPKQKAIVFNLYGLDDVMINGEKIGTQAFMLDSGDSLVIPKQVLKNVKVALMIIWVE